MVKALTPLMDEAEKAVINISGRSQTHPEIHDRT